MTELLLPPHPLYHPPLDEDSFVDLSKFAIIVQFHVNSAPQLFVHPENVYVYCASFVVGVAVTVTHEIVSTFSFTEIIAP